MCEMLNLFVPARSPVLPAPVRGLRFAPEGEIQRDFAARFASSPGVLLAGHGGGPCLCGFDDWDALYAIAREVLAANASESLAVLHFWSGTRYALGERAIDVDYPEVCTPLVLGELARLHREPAERRRHRLVVRGLTRAVGERVTLRLKSGRSLHGVLSAFDAESEVGRVESRTFVGAEVLALEREG